MQLLRCGASSKNEIFLCFSCANEIKQNIFLGAFKRTNSSSATSKRLAMVSIRHSQSQSYNADVWMTYSKIGSRSFNGGCLRICKILRSPFFSTFREKKSLFIHELDRCSINLEKLFCIKTLSSNTYWPLVTYV